LLSNPATFFISVSSVFHQLFFVVPAFVFKIQSFAFSFPIIFILFISVFLLLALKMLFIFIFIALLFAVVHHVVF